MTKDGYTLVEMLVALVILGLAIGGLTQAVHVIGRTQSAAAVRLQDDQTRRRIGDVLRTLLAGSGPFASDAADQFAGTDAGFTFACSAGARCGATITYAKGEEVLTVTGSAAVQAIPLPAKTLARFDYQGSQTLAPRWPLNAARPETLRSISLTDAATGDVIAETKLWPEQAPDCRFDAIAEACRRSVS